MTMGRLPFSAAVIAAVALVVPAFALAGRELAPAARVGRWTGERTTWDSVFTVEQVSRGLTAYSQDCSKCHQPSLGGADDAPALTGGAFLGNWSGQTLGDLHYRILTSMPPDDPGIYGRQQVSDVIAYLLSVNGYPAGRIELPVEAEALQGVRIVAVSP